MQEFITPKENQFDKYAKELKEQMYKKKIIYKKYTVR